MKWFRVNLDIGIAGDVRADHYAVSNGMLSFYSATRDQPLAVYALASVSSVEECERGHVLPLPRRVASRERENSFAQDQLDVPSMDNRPGFGAGKN